jgi:hypothetical protein
VCTLISPYISSMLSMYIILNIHYYLQGCQRLGDDCPCRDPENMGAARPSFWPRHIPSVAVQHLASSHQHEVYAAMASDFPSEAKEAEAARLASQSSSDPAATQQRPSSNPAALQHERLVIPSVKEETATQRRLSPPIALAVTGLGRSVRRTASFAQCAVGVVR